MTTTAAAKSAVKIALELPHTQCPRCRVWSRRPEQCPNCGAPLDVNETGDCKFCGAAVTSGKFDWVLSKIDQANDWEG